jgi:hypothetical protein
MTQFTENDMKPTTDEMFKIYKTLPEQELAYLMNPSSFDKDILMNSVTFWTCFYVLLFYVFGFPFLGTCSLIGLLLTLNKHGFNYLKKVERYKPAMRARILTLEHYNDFLISKMSVEEYHKKWNVVINENTKLWTLEELSPISNECQFIFKYLIIIGCISLYILL